MFKDITQNEKVLIHKAFKYTDQHRSELERELEADKSGHNKGRVVDEKNDRRLSENKDENKDENREKREAEEEDAREKEEVVKRNQQKLQQIKQLQEHKPTLQMSANKSLELELRNNSKYGSAIRAASLRR